MIAGPVLFRPCRACGLWTRPALLRPALPQLSSSFVWRSSAVKLSPVARFYATSPHKLPERLLVYHAGTPRTTFLACLKVTTIFGLAFFSFLVAPAYIAAEKPWWQVAGVAACGVVPFVFIAYTTAPFVAFVHLRLPPFARHPDRTLLRRFTANPPPATLLDFTTMNLVGRPRVTTVALGDLAPAHERLRVVNVVRRPTTTPAGSRPTLSATFPWIHLPPPTRFGAPRAGYSRGTREGWAWDAVLDCLDRRAADAAAGRPPAS